MRAVEATKSHTATTDPVHLVLARLFMEENRRQFKDGSLGSLAREAQRIKLTADTETVPEEPPTVVDSTAGQMASAASAAPAASAASAASAHNAIGSDPNNCPDAARPVTSDAKAPAGSPNFCSATNEQENFHPNEPAATPLGILLSPGRRGKSADELTLSAGAKSRVPFAPFGYWFILTLMLITSQGGAIDKMRLDVLASVAQVHGIGNGNEAEG
ncbi:MAG TPA: hypothetical protein V6C72_13730, partial [Chroococcales cyanobacterium]